MIIRPRERHINLETVVVFFTKVVPFMVDKDRWCLRRLGQENTSIQRVNTNTAYIEYYVEFFTFL